MLRSDSRRGASGITYALAVGLIAVVAIAAIGRIGGTTSTLFSQTSNSINGATGASGGSGGAPAVADPCAGSPTVGTRCSDGSVYAGRHDPDGGGPLAEAAYFVQPCDAGMSYTGSSCTGTRQYFTFNTWDVNGNNALDIAGIIGDGVSDNPAHTAGSGGSSTTDGRANTEYHAARSDAGASYKSSAFCANSTFGGKSDWYLVARNELPILYNNRAAVGGFIPDGQCYDTVGSYNIGAGRHGITNNQKYSSSTELGQYEQEVAFFCAAQLFHDPVGKYHAHAIRCVRRVE